jgi:hypothetical protein
MRVVVPLIAFPARRMYGHVGGNAVPVHKAFRKIRCQFPALFRGQFCGQGKLELTSHSCIFSFLGSLGGIPKFFTTHVYARGKN